LISDFDIFVPIFHVQPLWELNPNKAKSLEFKGYAKFERKKGGDVQKHQKRTPCVFLLLFFISPLSLPPFLSLALT